MWISARGGCGTTTCCDVRRCQTVRLDLILHLGTGLVMVLKSDLLGDDGIRGCTSLFHHDLLGGGSILMCTHVVWVDKHFSVNLRRPLPYCTWQNGAWRASLQSSRFGSLLSLWGRRHNTFTHAGVDMFELCACT